MTLLPLFERLGQTWPGIFLRDSTLAFALTEAVHLIALSLLGGVVATIGLSAAGIGLSRDWAVALARSLRPLFLIALALVILSGTGLVAAGPYKYYTNAVFWWKLSLLPVAVLIYAGLDYRLSATGQATALGSRAIALLLILVWLAVAIAGRLIGLI